MPKSALISVATAAEDAAGADAGVPTVPAVVKVPRPTPPASGERVLQARWQASQESHRAQWPPVLRVLRQAALMRQAISPFGGDATREAARSKRPAKDHASGGTIVAGHSTVGPRFASAKEARISLKKVKK